ncbi:metallophosphoesterase [uncultured Paraglaciecola sp.]|uniref:metallophosphoesterase family protein n=1 Tax=uncultured Paraglaciecola sp. TaxID=1765024 RepID=UPI0025EA5F30|nr:metallophosphoesterase [uncultured Paraglaciecola sp.]
MTIVETKGVPWNDGTLFGKEKYEQLDPFWLISALNYALNLMSPSDIVEFPNNVAYSGQLSPKPNHVGSDPVIGIVGDWGTGLYTDKNGVNSSISPSERVMNDIKKNHKLDYLLHLGDVYYAGTEYRPFSFEEWLNFKVLWPDQGKDRNFTLNSNHEMYGDASGYFKVALESDGPFGHQNGMSYFSVNYGKWLLIGLDSGYYSDSANGTKFYMDGAIGTDLFNQQIKWLESFKEHDGPIMIMSHHNPCDFTGDVLDNTLWKQVTDAIGTPAVWYYGHVHNGVVYTQLKDGAAIPYIPTKARCCGHGAIPFGNAWETQSNIDYYAHTPDTVMGAPRVLNGYATITLHADGSYDESFYESGNAVAVYTRHWAVNELQTN